MPWFRHNSITGKLTWMNMLVSGTALLVACGAFMTCETVLIRRGMVGNLGLQSEIIGNNSVSALLFNDPQAADNTLAVYQSSPHIVFAWIYSPDGHPFAGYRRNRKASPPVLPALSAGQTENYWFSDGKLSLVRAVTFHDKLTAYVYMQSDLGVLYERLGRYAEITMGVLLASLFAAFLVSWGTRRVVAKPIEDLSETARVVSRDKNYSVRAKPTGGADEISTLIDTFNGMLAQIQQRDDALRKAKVQFDLALISAGVGTWNMDVVHQTVIWDGYMPHLFGLTPGTFSGKPEEQLLLVHPDDQEGMAEQMKTPTDVNGHIESEFRVIWPDNSIHTLTTRGRLYRDEAGHAVRMTGVCWDVTERKRAEDALTESEERYRFLFEANPHSMWIYDSRTLAFLAVNDTAVRVFGYSREEFLKMKITDLHPAEEGGASQGDAAAKEQGFGERGTATLRKKDRSIIHVEFASHNLPFSTGTSRLVSVGDITERKRLEDQLRQSQKMEAIGRLAGGIAHDFNNLLTVIGGYSQMVRDGLDSNNPLCEDVSEVLKAGERAASLTRQLLAFSRQQVLAPRLVDLNDLVLNTEKMLRRLIGEDVELVTALERELGQIKADPGQIEQAIMNLVVNARDAMPSGGKLTIETSNVEVDESYAREHTDIKPGPHVMLAVSDTGSGMNPETQKRIFEPFFTTKEKGKGTGLGLAMVYGIVRQSGGYIWMYSEVNIGTVFKLYFPRSREAKEAARAMTTQVQPARGWETILLVEDENALRLLVQSVLERKGYKVLAPKEVREALTLLENHPGPIHLLLTDIVMPKMSGRELAELATALHPDTKVIYMSGYTTDAIVQNGILESNRAFLQKPFSPDAVLRKVREVLDQTDAN